MVPRALCLILAALHDVEAEHPVIDFLLELLKVDDQLITVLVESWSVLSLHQTMDLQFLVQHRLYLLHGLQNEEPRLHVKHVAETVGNIEECFAD